MNKLAKSTNDLSRAVFFANISTLERIYPEIDKFDQYPEAKKDDYSDIFGPPDQTEELAKKIRSRYGDEDEDEESKEDEERGEEEDDDKEDEDDGDYRDKDRDDEDEDEGDDGSEDLDDFYQDQSDEEL